MRTGARRHKFTIECECTGEECPCLGKPDTEHRYCECGAQLFEDEDGGRLYRTETIFWRSRWIPHRARRAAAPPADPPPEAVDT
jgi:hypothetical protein